MIKDFLPSAKNLPPILLAGILVLYPALSQAYNKVSSPDVTRGQMEFEYRGGYDNDDAAAKDGQQTHKFIANYGITDRWRTEIKADLTGNRSDMDWTYAEWSVRYQLLKDKEGWCKLALQENFKFGLTENKPDKLEQTILASKDTGPFTHIANVNFETELGSHAEGGTDINIGWKTKYHYNPYFEPGAETYIDFGRYWASSKDAPRKSQLGPVASGKIIDGVKYEVGYLFGLNENAPDSRLKFILTYTF